jgi:hypothetical protein
METTTGRILQSDEGVSTPDINECCTPFVNPEPPAEPTSGDGACVSEEVPRPPAGYENVPQELWPGEDGKPPEVTERLLKTLRGKYFTVRHVRLDVCDHLLDMINQPKNNCEQCWWIWFQTHPQLMETADQFYRTQGRKPLIAMRGLVFVRMFERTMATIIHRQQEDREKYECEAEKAGVRSEEILEYTSATKSSVRELQPTQTL